MKANREDVVQSALTMVRYCREHRKMFAECDCPLADGQTCFIGCAPEEWELEEYLRTRGLENGEV